MRVQSHLIVVQQDLLTVVPLLESRRQHALSIRYRVVAAYTALGLLESVSRAHSTLNGAITPSQNPLPVRIYERRA